jgi:hypothetical protein
MHMRNVNAPLILVLVASLATSARAQPGTSGDTVEDRSTVDIHGRVIDRWVPRDAHGLAIHPEQFYRDVGRPDLIEARAQRRALAIGTLIGGLALTGVSAYFLMQVASLHADTRLCDPSRLSFSQFAACGQASVDAQDAVGRQGDRDMMYSGGALLGSAVVLTISTYLFLHPEPVTEEEAERLAADANRRHMASVAPYAQAGGGGLMVAGRF